MKDETHERELMNCSQSKVDDGIVEQGDKIPSKRELAKRLRTKSASFRVGIGLLAAMGVLRASRSGIFVVKRIPGIGRSSQEWLDLFSGINSEQLLEARLVLECNLAALAAMRGTMKHFSLLAEELANMYATIDAPEEYCTHKIRFHQEVARASGHAALGGLVATIPTILRGERGRTIDGADRLRSSHEHRTIYRAIRAKNAIEAWETMRYHLISPGEQPYILARTAIDDQKSVPRMPC